MISVQFTCLCYEFYIHYHLLHLIIFLIVTKTIKLHKSSTILILLPNFLREKLTNRQRVQGKHVQEDKEAWQGGEEKDGEW